MSDKLLSYLVIPRVDYRCENDRFTASAIGVTFSDPDLLSSSETELNPAVG
jgi:hypothetical protein